MRWWLCGRMKSQEESELICIFFFSLLLLYSANSFDCYSNDDNNNSDRSFDYSSCGRYMLYLICVWLIRSETDEHQVSILLAWKNIVSIEWTDSVRHRPFWQPTFLHRSSWMCPIRFESSMLGSCQREMSRNKASEALIFHISILSICIFSYQYSYL